MYVNEVTVEFALGISYVHAMQLISSLCSEYMAKILNSTPHCSADNISVLLHYVF